jgi:hypothetical protein
MTRELAPIPSGDQQRVPNRNQEAPTALSLAQQRLAAFLALDSGSLHTPTQLSARTGPLTLRVPGSTALHAPRLTQAVRTLLRAHQPMALRPHERLYRFDLIAEPATFLEVALRSATHPEGPGTVLSTVELGVAQEGERSLTYVFLPETFPRRGRTPLPVAKACSIRANDWRGLTHGLPITLGSRTYIPLVSLLERGQETLTADIDAVNTPVRVVQREGNSEFGVFTVERVARAPVRPLRPTGDRAPRRLAPSLPQLPAHNYALSAEEHLQGYTRILHHTLNLLRTCLLADGAQDEAAAEGLVTPWLPRRTHSRSPLHRDKAA